MPRIRTDADRLEKKINIRISMPDFDLLVDAAKRDGRDFSEFVRVKVIAPYVAKLLRKAPGRDAKE